LVPRGPQRDVVHSAFVYESKCGGGVAGSQPMSTAEYMEAKYTLEIY
jgi:hypothetical protein